MLSNPNSRKRQRGLKTPLFRERYSLLGYPHASWERGFGVSLVWLETRPRSGSFKTISKAVSLGKAYRLTNDRRLLQLFDNLRSRGNQGSTNG